MRFKGRARRRRAVRPAGPRLRIAARGTARRTIVVLLAALVCAGATGYGLLRWWEHERLHPSTEDAFLDAHVVMIRPQVAGEVVAVHVRENQRVDGGATLFEIDPRPYRAALDAARATLEIVRNAVASDAAAIAAVAAEVELDRARVVEALARGAHARDIFERVRTAADDGDASVREVIDATERVRVSEAEVVEARMTLVAGEARLREIARRLGDPAAEQARIDQAAAQVAIAEIDLGHCVVTAPAAGTVTRFDLRVGQFTNVGDALFPFIADGVWWIEANFKETQVARMVPGQPATFTVDMYPDATFAARIESISRGSAAAFSLLPPQNTTGNWVKVTQRVPVRLAIDPSTFDPGRPFRKGASVWVEVDTTAPPTPVDVDVDDPPQAPAEGRPEAPRRATDASELRPVASLRAPPHGADRKAGRKDGSPA